MPLHTPRTGTIAGVGLLCLTLAACSDPEPGWGVHEANGTWVLAQIDGRPVPAPSANAGGEVLGATLQIWPYQNLVAICPETTIEKPVMLQMVDDSNDPENYGYASLDLSRIELHYRDGWQPDTLIVKGDRADFHYRVTHEPSTVAEHWTLRRVSRSWDPAAPLPPCDQP